jgi:hypothetical protein
MKPAAYAHVGWLFGRDPGLGWDAGLVVDLIVARRAQLGGHLGLLGFGAAPALTAGAEVGVLFGHSK